MDKVKKFGPFVAVLVLGLVAGVKLAPRVTAWIAARDAQKKVQIDGTMTEVK